MSRTLSSRSVAALLATAALTWILGTTVLGSVLPSAAAALDAAPAAASPKPLIDGAPLIATTDGTPTISGTGIPYAAISGSVGTQPCTASVGFDGHWSCTVALGSDGDYPITLTQTASGSSAGPAATATLHLDRTPPAAPEFTSPVSTGGGGGALTTSQTTFTMTGTAEPGAVVQVIIMPGGTVYCETNANAEGAWSCDGGPLPLGSYTVIAVATDELGNVGAPGGTGFQLTIVAPAAPKPPPAPLPTTPRVDDRLLPAVPFALHISSETGADLDGATIALGDRVILWGTGLPAGSPFTAELHSRVIALGEDRVGTGGEFRLLVTVPTAISPGAHEFVVRVAPRGHAPSTATRTIVIASPVVAAEQPRTIRSHNVAQTSVDVAASVEPVPDDAGDSFDDPSVIGHSVPPFDVEKLDAASLITAGGISALFLLLVALPAELLESTLRENQARAFRWFDPVRQRIRRFSARFRHHFANPWVASLVLIVVGGVILGFADPHFGFNEKSIRIVLGMVISLTVLNVVISALVIGYGRRRWGVRNDIIPIPAALLIVAGSVILSRVTGISPAFLFGLVVGIVWTHRQTIRQEGRLVLLLMALTMVVGVSSYIIYSVLAGSHEEGFSAELGKEVTAALTIESLSTLIVALMPFQFLDGQKIFRWSRVAWIATYVVALVTFVLIVAPVAEESGLLIAEGWGWLVAFVVFAVVALGAWALFRIFPERTTEAAEPDEQAEAVVSSPSPGTAEGPPSPRPPR